MLNNNYFKIPSEENVSKIKNGKYQELDLIIIQCIYGSIYIFIIFYTINM